VEYDCTRSLPKKVATSIASVIEINSQDIQTFVVEILDNEMDISGTFIEGRFIDETWSRYDGTPLLYSNWDTPNDQPSTLNDLL
jgi:hypothetical protein